MASDMITVFGTPYCGACTMFKQKLEAAKLQFISTNDYAQLAKASEESGLMSAPIVRIGDVYHTASSAAEYLGI